MTADPAGYRQVCATALTICEQYFSLIEKHVPPAQWVPWEDSYNWRFVERLPSQALLQKLARQISGLKALDVLLSAGMLQEVGVLFRMLDEIGEDILFICLALTTNKWTKSHHDYLSYFWSENEDDRQPPVRRKSIRAFINRVYNLPDPSGADAAGRSIYKTYSDFVHVRSAPIMAMVSGPPARFNLNGIDDADAQRPFVEQFPTYFWRCLASTSIVAKITTPVETHSACYAKVKKFEADHSEMLFPL